MGRKADKRAARLASALEREWWASAAQCWVYIGDAIRWQTDPVYRAEVRAERAQRNKMRAVLGAMLALGMGAMDEWTYRQTLMDGLLQEQERCERS